MTNILEGLSQEQLEAVTCCGGPLLIIAGAGTGKTAVITRRIAWLLAEGLCKTEEILALTFTDKAAQEMLERVDILVPYGYTDIWISTFHAFGDRLLRENALVCGINPDFKVLSRPEACVFFREHLFEFKLDYYRPLAEPTRFIEAILALFSRCKDEDISPQEYLAFARKLTVAAGGSGEAALKEEAQQHLELAGAYEKYQLLLEGEGLVDFGNQFYLALRLLREHPAVLKRYRQQFKYILVDEFQDTNFVQYQLAKLLAGESGNITVTGDDDQCIYRFRGAAYSNLLNFVRDFPRAKKVSLIRNYRSTQSILDSAYQLIQHNNPERFEVKAGINKKLSAQSNHGAAVAYQHFETNSLEADWVACLIKDKVTAGGYKFRDFAILVRSNSDAQSYLQSLNMQDIPWKFSGNQGLYSTEEVRLCISFLRVIANHADSLQLYYLASSEIYKMDLTDLTLCMHIARRRNKSLYAVLSGSADNEELVSLKEETRRLIAGILQDLEKFLLLSRVQTTGRLLYSFLTDSGYLKRLAASQSLEAEAKIQNIAKFFSLLRDFELVTREDRVVNFVNYLNLMIEAGDDPATVEADPDSDAVNVLTIHKAKGLEFREVFLVSLVNGRFPVSRRRQLLELPDELIKEILPEGDFHLQEERRLFYVGMTRAKERLYLTSAADYGGKLTRKPSQFVIEVMGKEATQQQKAKESALEAIERFRPVEEAKKAGRKITPADKAIALSYYHIDDYLTCPLKYKYVNILRVPILEHHSVIYGRAMHEAVCRFFQSRLAGKAMSLEELLHTFNSSFDPQGFLDEQHQAERLRTGQEALSRFYHSRDAQEARPLYIEKEFHFSFENSRISGRLDRVDQRAGAEVIIDFKTSEVSKQEAADEKARANMQLVLYAWAYQNVFGSLPEEGELHFLESGLVGKRTIREKDIDKLKDEIREVSAGIRQEEFPASPAYLACNYCAFSQVCPSAAVR
jgi:DNA helicase-2/ATP-dependent DNA helicase PcrA